MYEIILNMHMHTVYSDGSGTHEDVARAAITAGLDAIIITDHNVWVDGPQGYFQEDSHKVLVLNGEEVHDQSRDPQKNHMIVVGVDKEMAPYGDIPQQLVQQVEKEGGITFLAHPIDPEASNFDQEDLSWVDWDVTGYTGIELWNAMTEFKSKLRDKLRAIFYAYYPHAIARGPFPETLKLWDTLTQNGTRVVAIGGSDAHAMEAHLGPLRRILFPYEFHFRCVNTHVLLTKPPTGDAHIDQMLILNALRNGHGFIAYDLPASTRGFKFYAQGQDRTVWMGDEISSRGGITMQINLPEIAECVLIKDGKTQKRWADRKQCVFITREPGVYRVEVTRRYLGARVGWIYSNPIYVR